jgi:hypothetical protein
MNYQKHYELLIERAKSRAVDPNEYGEVHHIVPRSEGGDNSQNNLVKLTAREHFLAHWLLYRMDPTIDSRAFSFWRMCNGRGKVSPSDWIVVSSHAYEEARIAHSQSISKRMKGYKKTAEHQEKINKALTGQKRSDEAKLKMSIAKKGKPLKQSHKDSMRGRTPWNKGQQTSEETAILISRALKGNNNAGKPCSIEGRVYSSATEAANAESIPIATLKNRIRNAKKVDYFYLK